MFLETSSFAMLSPVFYMRSSSPETLGEMQTAYSNREDGGNAKITKWLFYSSSVLTMHALALLQNSEILKKELMIRIGMTIVILLFPFTFVLITFLLFIGILIAVCRKCNGEQFQFNPNICYGII